MKSSKNFLGFYFILYVESFSNFSCPIIPLDVINGVMLLLPVLDTRCGVGSVIAVGLPVTILIYKYKIKKIVNAKAIFSI